MSELRTPDRVREIIAEIQSEDYMRDGIEAMMMRSERESLASKLMGIAMNPMATAHWNKRLDEWWAETQVPKTADEVVVGSGLHAAIYCATRVAMGNAKPLVIERSSRAGGIFAISESPSFYLNSRNRPGARGVPGRDEALNYIPMAVVQPCDLSGDEYQPNTALSFAIRAMLAMYAKVVTSVEVTRMNDLGKGGPTVFWKDEEGNEKSVDSKMAIWATGLGDPKKIFKDTLKYGESIMTYPEFLQRFDTPFPLMGLNRVAVIGAGDSGKTVIEALIGQGPTSRMSVASMDFPERIDWYGVNSEVSTREDFENCNRSRYKGIARALPRRNQVSPARVYPTNQLAEFIESSYNGVYVNGVFYDAAIIATGFTPPMKDGIYLHEFGSPIEEGNRKVALRWQFDKSFVIGPACQFPKGAYENGDIPENTVALFRYADRTAQFAMAQPNTAPPKPKKQQIEYDQIFMKRMREMDKYSYNIVPYYAQPAR